MGWDLYLTEVLGVQQVVGEVLPPAPAVDPDQVRFLFVAEARTSSLADLPLFQKMLAGMKVNPSEVLILETSVLDLATHEKEIRPEWVIVSFSPKLAEWLQTQRPRQSVLLTSHPEEIEKDPSLKRPVWETLKRALEKSGLSSRLQS